MAVRRRIPPASELRRRATARHNLVVIVGVAVMLAYALGAKLGIVSTTYGIFGGLVGGLAIGVLLKPDENLRTPLEYGVFAALYAFAGFLVLAVAYNIVLTGRYDVTIGGMEGAPTEFASQLYIYGILEAVRGVLFLVAYVLGGGLGGWLGSTLMNFIFPSRTIWTPAWKKRSSRIRNAGSDGDEES